MVIYSTSAYQCLDQHGQRVCTALLCTALKPSTLSPPSAGTSAVGGQFYTIAQSLLPNDTSLLATAELFARLGAAQFDANVLGWYLKFYYLFWRPVNAIR